MHEDHQECLEALEKAVEVIKQWHGEVAFDIYFNHSPEMKPVKDILNKHKVDAAEEFIVW